MTTTEIRRERGRPRDPQVGPKILQAARELVGELGIRNVSMSAVADRAGCGKPTIYLRWRNVHVLLVAALAEVDVDPVALELAYQAHAALGALRQMQGGAFIAEVAALTNGRDEWAEVLWPLPDDAAEAA